MKGGGEGRQDTHEATLLLLLSGLALAQGFDAHGFHIAGSDGDIRDPILTQRPGPFTQGDFWFSGLGSYAKAPLVQVIDSEVGGEAARTIALDHVTALNISAGVAFHERVRLDVKAPVFFVSEGFEELGGPAMGDVRSSLMVVAIRPDYVQGEPGGFGGAVVAHVDAPSGTGDERFLGQSGVAGGARWAMTYELDRATFSGDIGAQFNPAIDQENLNGADNLLASLAVGVTASDFVGFTLEGHMAPPLQTNEIRGAGFPAEVLLSMRYRGEDGGYYTFGGSGGLTEGIGAATFRVFMGGGWGKVAPPRPPDTDVLATFAVEDACPLKAEVINDYQDDDGCPDDVASLQVYATDEGERTEAALAIVGPEGEQEGSVTADTPWRAEVTPGSELSFTATAEGCLEGTASVATVEGANEVEIPLQPVLPSSVVVEVVDEEGAPITDASVVWRSELPRCVPELPAPVDEAGRVQQPMGAGEHALTVSAPKYLVHDETVTLEAGEAKTIQVVLEPVEVKISRVRVEKKRIVILDKVLFEVNKAVIREESHGLLDDVRDVIITNPHILLIEVAGHTDSQGSESYNQDLSQRRAEAVRDYLVEKGVEPERLVAKGYGEAVPIDTNRTPEGREKNRRVEFNILEPNPDADTEDGAGDEENADGGTP